jgi:type II secretory pathway pseudopilin PulG
MSTHTKRKRQSGMTLIEVLIVGLMTVLIGCGLWTLLRSSYDSQQNLLDQNTAGASVRVNVDTIVDGLRQATSISAATISDLTYGYSDSAGNSHTIRYWTNNGNLLRTIDGAPNGGTVVGTGVTLLTFTYYTWNVNSWVSTVSPSTPSLIGAVDVTIQTNVNGATRLASGSVQIRQKRF